MELSPLEHLKLQRALRGDLEIPRHLVEGFERHLPHCRACQRILGSSGQLREKLKKYFTFSAHLSQEQLLIYLTGQAAALELSEADIKMLGRQRAHLKTCSLCRRRVQHLRKELARCEDIVFGPVEEVRAHVLHEMDLIRPDKPWRRSSSAFAKTFVPGVILAAVSLSAIALHVALKPPLYEHTNPLSDQYSDCFVFYRSPSEPAPDRSPFTANLNEAQIILCEGHEQQALAFLAKIDERNLQGEYLLRFHLYRLMAILKLAHSDLFGFFPKFDTTRIAPVLQNMEAVLLFLRPPDAELNPMYLGPAYYYAAKGCVIANRRPAALAHLGNSLGLPQHGRTQQALLMQKQLAE